MIARYAAENGVAAALRHFKTKQGLELKESWFSGTNKPFSNLWRPNLLVDMKSTDAALHLVHIQRIQQNCTSIYRKTLQDIVYGSTVYMEGGVAFAATAECTFFVLTMLPILCWKL